MLLNLYIDYYDYNMKSMAIKIIFEILLVLNKQVF